MALTITCTVLLASAGAFSTSIRSVNQAQKQSRGGVFLQTILEDLAAQPYENLPTFNGNKFYDKPTVGASAFSVTLTVFLASVDLQQVQAVLTDTRTNRVIGRVTTLRSRK